MQSTTSRKTITVNYKDKSEEMSLETYSRWLCLIEAIELVCGKAKQIKVDISNNMDWIKPLAFQKYIEERHESMKDEIEHFENSPELKIITKQLCNTQQELTLQ
ncbi:hypothetical protein EB118_03240 [bacterium]|nr:hypothetical protein [bacterium]